MWFNIRAYSILALAPVVLVGGCVDVPSLPPPATARQPADIAASQSLSGASSAAWPGEGWWTTLGDAQLASLVEEGLARSPDMAAAQARLRRAEGLAQAAMGPLLPSLDVKGSASEDKLSYNTGFPRQFLPQGWNDNGQLAASLGWELDLWGRNRAAFAAARSEREAAYYDTRQARLLLAATIAVAYADYARLTDEAAIRKAGLVLRDASRTLVTQRVAAGLDTLGSQRLAEAQAATARADLAATEEGLALRRHQLAALVGGGPDRGLAMAPPDWRAGSPVGVPSDATTALVVRRPDVAMSRERMLAAAARVKSARADFYPAIRLEALYGVQALGLGQLFDSGSTYGRAGPVLSLPIFHGGALRGRYRGVRASFDEAVADYDRTVLAAYQQAADAVTSRAATSARLADARAAVAASEQAYDVARRRYGGGLSTYLDVLAVEDRLVQARLAASGIQAADRVADIALIRALGGGFAVAGAGDERTDDE